MPGARRILTRNMLRDLEKNSLEILDEYFLRIWNQLSSHAHLVLGMMCFHHPNKSVDRPWIVNLFTLLEYLLTEENWCAVIEELELTELVEIDRRGALPFIQRLRCSLFEEWVARHVHYYQNIYTNLNIKDRNIPLKSLIAADKKMRNNKTLDYFTAAINMQASVWDQIIGFCKIWVACVSERKGEIVDGMGFLANFVNFIGNGVASDINREGRFCYLSTRFSDNANYADYIIPLMLILGQRAISHEDFSKLERIALNLKRPHESNFPVIIFAPQKMHKDDREKFHKGNLFTVVIDEEDFQSILFSENPSQEMIQFVLRKGNITLLNPYRTSGACTNPWMIVGREKEIQELIHKKGLFLVTGPRKIGKSTLLTECKRLLQLKKKEPSLYLDCIHIKDENDLFTALNLEIRQDDSLPKLSKPLESFETLEEYAGVNQITLIMDEFDAILDSDIKNNHRIANWLHGIASNQRARVAIAGWRVVFRAAQDGEHPLYNAGNKLTLYPLDKEASNRLIQNPFSNLLIEIDIGQQSSILDQIFQLTGGYPALIQRIGELLVNQYASNQLKPLTLEDLSKILSLPAMRDEIAMFLDNISSIQQRIGEEIVKRRSWSIEDCYEFFRQSSKEFTTSEFREALFDLESLGIILFDKQAKSYHVGNQLYQEFLSKSPLTKIIP